MPTNDARSNDLSVRVQSDARWLDEGTRPITIAEIESRAATPRRFASPRRWRVTVGVALITVVVLAAIAYSALTSNSNSTSHLRVASPLLPSASAHPALRRGAPLYLEPTYIPPGFSLVRAEGGNHPGQSIGSAGSREWTRTQRWVRFDSAHEKVLGTLGIEWGPGARAGRATPDSLAPFGPEGVAVTVRGRRGWYWSRGNAVDWAESADQEVLIDCDTCSRVDLVRIANSLNRRSDGGFEWPEPHDGFVLVNEAPGMESFGTNLREATYGDGHGNGFQIMLVDDTQQPPLSQLAMPGLSLADLRNTQAVIGSRLNVPGDVRADTAFMVDPTLIVQWLEYPNVAVTVAGKNVNKTTLLQIATGLREVDSKRWSEMQTTPRGPGSVDDKVYSQYPRQQPLAATVADSDRYPKKDLRPGVYQYSIAGRSAQLSLPNGRVIRPAIYQSPTRYEFDLKPDGSWESFPLLADGRAAPGGLHQSHKDGVYQISGDGIAAPPAKIVPLGPLHDFSSRAIQILLGEAARNRRLSTDASTTRLSTDLVTCMTKSCVHVESEYGVNPPSVAAGDLTPPWKSSGNVQRDDLIFDPESGFVYYHLVTLNGQPVTEFRLLAAPTLSP